MVLSSSKIVGEFSQDWFFSADFALSEDELVERTEAVSAICELIENANSAEILALMSFCLDDRISQVLNKCQKAISSNISETEDDIVSEKMLLKSCLIAAFIDNLLGENSRNIALVSAAFLSAVSFCPPTLQYWNRVALNKVMKEASLKSEALALELRATTSTESFTSALAEELDLLWWSQNNSTPSSSRGYTKATQFKRCVSLGMDLAFLVHLPPTQSARNLLVRQMSGLKTARTLVNFVDLDLGCLNRHSREISSGLVLDNPIIFPLLNAYHAGTANQTILQRNWEPEKWALQIFNEFVVLRICEAYEKERRAK